MCPQKWRERYDELYKASPTEAKTQHWALSQLADSSLRDPPRSSAFSAFSAFGQHDLNAESAKHAEKTQRNRARGARALRSRSIPGEVICTLPGCHSDCMTHMSEIQG